ncbi:uncharacterized protein L969DRAFT_79320 [Mixia osmundae IAM 14324]|uniref:Uncharacterized protein n=1 Tax=Mixia osmundae (strain CBS 9802 / IAM 14324 / JCM 22182 / KY 12970) TaxID=764103 RepID=G7E2G0_MIXOS|nr:uncharacterized protein L969DRAFT_79320 [Mixia osmundae IAM 14324]KEI36890.1 hypothetical protein L969DRAFT_79320 [Mixia osmundae IAM 14324]GAA97020.1 hypothetical protein E5Q_03695 [Mixia osmundae IAM 14324]
MISRTALLTLLASLLLSLHVSAQTAAPFPPLVYTYAGESADPSLLSAVSSAAGTVNGVINSVASDTATGAVAPFATTSTALPTSAQPVTSDFAFSSATPGVVLSSNTRPEFTASGTPPATSSATTAPTASSAHKDILLPRGLTMALSLVSLTAVFGSFLCFV